VIWAVLIIPLDKFEEKDRRTDRQTVTLAVEEKCMRSDYHNHMIFTTTSCLLIPFITLPLPHLPLPHPPLPHLPLPPSSSPVNIHSSFIPSPSFLSLSLPLHLIHTGITYLICALAPRKNVPLLVFVWAMGYMTGSHVYR
jgi:hypothetical protein